MVVVEPARQCLLCLYGSSMGPTNQYFVKGPGNLMLRLSLVGVVGCREAAKSVHLQWEMAWSQILALLLTQHRF